MSKGSIKCVNEGHKLTKITFVIVYSVCKSEYGFVIKQVSELSF